MVRVASLACVASAFAILEGASADVTFAEAAAMARAIHHDRPLIDIRFRTRANRSFFATSSINSFNTLLYTLRIDAASGVAEEGETEEILPPRTSRPPACWHALASSA